MRVWQVFYGNNKRKSKGFIFHVQVSRFTFRFRNSILNMFWGEFFIRIFWIMIDCSRNVHFGNLNSTHNPRVILSSAESLLALSLKQSNHSLLVVFSEISTWTHTWLVRVWVVSFPQSPPWPREWAAAQPVRTPQVRPIAKYISVCFFVENCWFACRATFPRGISP